MTDIELSRQKLIQNLLQTTAVGGVLPENFGFQRAQDQHISLNTMFDT
ncbi:hypothetical protein [Pseudidiomarina terrestris]|nr:hypothetical protein [Pseudidiomarina sp. 1ASP75-14]